MERLKEAEKDADRLRKDLECLVNGKVSLTQGFQTMTLPVPCFTTRDFKQLDWLSLKTKF